MSTIQLPNCKSFHYFLYSMFIIAVSLMPTVSFAAVPPNDSCTGAVQVIIPANGFGLGTFTSAQTDMTSATVQVGETFAPAIFVAGLDKKSVWYKFTLPTIRAVRVSLTQPGTTITAGDVGFSVYQTAACLPGNAQISPKLTPIVTFGNTYHPCVPAGEYLVQVSSKLAANGPIIIQLEISDQTGAPYDHPNQAYAFGVANLFSRAIDFDTECQSIEDSTEKCSVLFNYRNYNKSAWFTFTTPAYFDYLNVTLSGIGTPTYFNGANGSILKNFGYTLYKGNAVTTPIAALQVVDGCDSLRTNGYYCAVKQYKCNELERNTLYSVQLFFDKDFKDILRLGLMTGGAAPTAAPLPVTSMAASNQLGVLNASPNGTTTTVSDNWGCNSRHSVTACNPSIRDSGIKVNGLTYNLSSFVSFTLNKASAINFRPYSTACGPYPIVRIFKQSLTTNCADLDTNNIIATVPYNTQLDCLAPGNYVIQVMGRDEPVTPNTYNYSVPKSNYDQCLFANLGSKYRLDLIVYTRKGANNFSLNAPGAFDTINKVAGVQQPLLNGIPYIAKSDTIGCLSTLRPADTTCAPGNDKVIYRQFIIADSGTVDFANLSYSNNPPFRYKLYSGDANVLAIAQNLFNYPDRINGLTAKTLCLDGYTYCANKTACVVPGTYTFASMGSVGDVGRVDKPTFTFVKTRTLHNTPQKAQDMGSVMDTLGVNGGTKKSDVDYWSCDDNAVPINNYQPCTLGGRPAKKAIYRQFYLKGDALVRISNTSYGYCPEFAYGSKTLFYGKATDGLAGLNPVGNQWNCFASAQTANGCTFLPAGWYTVVSYGTGPSYDSTMRLVNVGGNYNSYVSYKDEFNITITPACPGPKFNRPYKASIHAVTQQPHQITWGFRSGTTSAYPRFDTTYILPTENFNCTLDTPFTGHPIKSCETGANRVVYYVFRTTQVSFLQISTGSYYAALYDKDVRTDSAQFATATPIQRCSNTDGFIQYCFFQPGTYTLVVYAKDANSCSSVTPRIYIDQIGYSRFDYANKAYDFDVVPPSSTFHFGKVGDVNPLNSNRKPSTDFFYCTTGAFATDPANSVCNTKINPNVYNNGPNKPLYDSEFPASNNVARRNLWYTFVAADAGTVTVKVENKTLTRGLQPRFSVYKSDVNASLPFADVITNGQIDSTLAQGLSFVAMNPIVYYPYYCYNALDYVTFYRDPCTSVRTRYYVLVENVNGYPVETGGQLPNTVIEVSVKIDSVNLVLPKFDKYSLAADIGTVGVGAFTGPTDNFSCATRDVPDPVYNSYSSCNKTLWYKFTSTITGNVRYRIKVGNTTSYDYGQVQLFKEAIPGDSTTNGLKIQFYSGVNTPTGGWGQTCVTKGTYYLLLPGCNRVNEYVFPEIELTEAVGDFCSRAIPAVISGAGAVTATALVNCHTIATDYGEFGPQLTCPQGGLTNQYKSSWFRMDIGGNDTLDVTAFLVENTNASSSDIKYRLMTGNCGAMQEQSCVQDALTQNTYQCLVPGQSYFVQVFTPLLKNNVPVTGTIDLKLSAIAHADTCAPLTNCLASANFNTSFNCTTDDSVKFVNFSTYGTSIAYKWELGLNGQTSTAVSPSFFYPALPADQTYTIKLLVENTSCGKRDSVTRTVTVPGRPVVKLGADIAQCNSTAPIILRATSHPGATYLWQNNTTADTLRVTATGNNNYSVRVTYNGCISRDTIRVLISPISTRPLQRIVLCTDSVSVNVRRGFGETYQWSTGASTQSIFVSNPGYYWADITYFDCTYRDSFEVINVNVARPLGNDTTICFARGGYLLNAKISGAISYTWQNNSTADTFLVTTPGQYRVTINFGNCTIRDTVVVSGYPALVTTGIDTSICYGQSLQLPWGTSVSLPGIYRDTLQNSTGCDSVIRRYTLTVKARPNIGRDTTICLGTGNYLLNATTTGAVKYRWQNGDTTATYAVTAAGLYWVEVDFGNCTARDSVVIGDLPAPTVVIKDTAICAGFTYTLPWGDLVTAAGSYRDTIQSSRGCDSLIRVVNLIVNTTPVLGRDTAVSTCAGYTYNLNVLYNTTGFNTSWTIGGQPVPNPAAVSTLGIYRLIVSNGSGCNDTALVALTISPKPILGIDKTASICAGNTYNLTTAFTTTGLGTSWTINNLPVINPPAVNSGGVYELIVTNAAGCKDTAVLALTITPKPALGADTTINICPGTAVNLQFLYNTTGYISNFTINGNAVADPGAVTASGIYQLIASVATGCSDTAIITIGHHPVPALGRDTTIGICPGTSINFSSLYNTTGLSANWSIGNVPVINPSAVNTAGTYRLIAINSNGCADTAVTTITVNPAPGLGNDTAIAACTGKFINLTSIYTTIGLNINWTLNGQPVPNPSLVAAAGVYQLIAINSFGCADTARVLFTLLPTPVAGRDTAITICQGQMINLTTLYNNTGLIANWTLNGTSVVNPATVSIGGVYRLVVTNTTGCTDTALVALTVNPRPNLGIDTTINICEGSSINLTSIYSITGNNNTWTTGGIPVPNPAAINVAGVYRLVSINGGGCSDTLLVTINIAGKPTLVITNPGTICPGQTTDLTAAAVTTGSTAGTTFTYWQNATATIAFNNPARAANGTYYIKAANATGCFVILPVTVINYTKPVVNAGADKRICNLDSTLLTATVTNSTSPVTYRWQPLSGGILNPSAASTLVLPGKTQQYIVSIEDGYGCNFIVSDTVLITVQPPVSAFAGNDTIAVRGQPHQLTASGGVRYTWLPGLYLSNPGIVNPRATLFTDSMRYVVKVEDIAGCIGYDTIQIKVYEGITYYVPNAFSPNQDGRNDIFRPIPVGIVSTEMFRIYNRYGDLVFETNQWMKGWDGMLKGVKQPVGNYVWILKGTGNNGRKIEMKGNVVLVR